jgi:hypothetical protein
MIPKARKEFERRLNAAAKAGEWDAIEREARRLALTEAQDAELHAKKECLDFVRATTALEVTVHGGRVLLLSPATEWTMSFGSWIELGAFLKVIIYAHNTIHVPWPWAVHPHGDAS